MSNITVRPATASDLDAVAEIYEDTHNMQASGINHTNWRKGVYPTRTDAIAGLRAGTLYVCESEKAILGSVILNHNQPPEWEVLRWPSSPGPQGVLVIHTLCVSPHHMGRGAGTTIMHFSEKLAHTLGCEVIRLDIYEGNIPAATLYGKLGYDCVGNTRIINEYGKEETILCFEKALRPVSL